MQDKLTAIVPAAGIGERARDRNHDGIIRPKQYGLLRGEPMLRWAVKTLLADPRIDRVLVAVAPNDIWAKDALQGLDRTEIVACGGATRALTVLGALLHLRPAAHDWALVHDAARPGLPALALARLIDTCIARQQGGLLAVPLADTIKRGADLVPDPNRQVNKQSEPVVIETVDREGLWAAQTPQMFRAHELTRALEQAQHNRLAITDEASAMEQIGQQPLLVLGSPRNFKVTWPDDFELMEKWL